MRLELGQFLRSLRKPLVLFAERKPSKVKPYVPKYEVHYRTGKKRNRYPWPHEVMQGKRKPFPHERLSEDF